MRLAVVLVIALGCGRIGYDARTVVLDDAGNVLDDAGNVVVDTPIGDAAAGCKAGMTPIATGSSVCIEIAERGTETWVDAKATCEGVGRRLCADLEWATACDNAAGLVDMINDEGGTNLNWEWVAEESAGVAQKRGLDACGAQATHEISIDPYDYRCCADL